MKFWSVSIFLFISIAGIVYLSCSLKTKERKLPSILGIVAFAILALVSIWYMAAAIVLINAVP